MYLLLAFECNFRLKNMFLILYVKSNCKNPKYSKEELVHSIQNFHLTIFNLPFVLNTNMNITKG